MAKKMFTEAGLERLRAPESGRVEYGDSVVRGLMLRVSETGVKSWSVLYKVKGEGGASPKTGRPLRGTQRRILLGVYPILGVKQARETAMDVLQKAFAGTDARVVRNEALLSRSANTVEAVAMLREADQVLFFDNVTTEIGSADLCKALTSSTIKGRILGVSENAILGTRTLMIFNGNNVRVAGDMTRRAVRCRIDPKLRSRKSARSTSTR